jgi:8-oxo-dGTP pyrophosphatase MutT (NUDIX family)
LFEGYEDNPMSFHIRVRAGAVVIQNDSILLVEFNDENGLHYNLPAGGVDPNETIIEAVKREAKEETSIEVEVGPLAFVYEYAPHLKSNKYGETHSLGLMFECKIKEGSNPRMPDNPDPNQTDVKWIKLSELHKVILYPNISEHIKKYIDNRRNIDLIEEHFLEEYVSK